MSVVKTIELRGWKGRDRRLDVTGPTLLVGRNGAGKSAYTDAVQFCLSGLTPWGKKELSEVAQHFGTRGGTVRLADEEGAWIERGVERDHEKKKNSLRMNTSTTLPGQPVDLGTWEHAEVGVDLRSFLALSGALRRDALAALVQGREGSPGEAWRVVDHAVAVVLAGEMATTELFRRPQVLQDEGNRAVAERYIPCREGLVVRSPGSLSAHYQAIAGAAKEARLECNRTKIEAERALKELSAGLEGAEAAVAELGDARTAAKAAAGAAREIEQRFTGAVTAKLQAERAEKGLQAAQDDLSYAKARMAEVPEVVAPGAYREALARHEASKAKLAEIHAAGAALHAGAKLVEIITGELECRKEGTATILKALVQEIPDDIHPSMPKVRWMVYELAKDEAEAILDCEGRLADKKAELAAIVYDPTSEIAAEADECAAALECSVLRQAQEDFDAAATKRQQIQNAIDAAQRGCDSWLRQRDEAFAEFERLASPTVKVPELVEDALGIAIRDFKAMVERAQGLERVALEASRKAERAAGALDAYRSTADRVRTATVDFRVYSLIEAAAIEARDREGGSTLEELRDELAGMLAAFGRPETPFVELEGARGKPAFECGWISNGEKVRLEALSSGEAACFMTALSLTMLMRSKTATRRILLLELDALDPASALALLEGLGSSGVLGELDLVLAATYHVFEVEPFGWRVINVS